MQTQTPPNSAGTSRGPEVINTGQCPPDGAPTDHFKAAMQRFGELKEYVSYFVATKIDDIKFSARNAAIYAALGIIGAIAGALVVVAVALLVIGAAHGICAPLGDRYWLGDLIIGLFILVLIGVGAMVGLKMLTKSFHKSTVNKYETRQHQQQLRLGHNIRQAPRSSDAALPPDKPAASLSESEFLAEQAQAAKDAMAKAWSDITTGLGKGVDPRQWAKAQSMADNGLGYRRRLRCRVHACTIQRGTSPREAGSHRAPLMWMAKRNITTAMTVQKSLEV